MRALADAPTSALRLALAEARALPPSRTPAPAAAPAPSPAVQREAGRRLRRKLDARSRRDRGLAAQAGKSIGARGLPLRRRRPPGRRSGSRPRRHRSWHRRDAGSADTGPRRWRPRRRRAAARRSPAARARRRPGKRRFSTPLAAAIRPAAAGIAALPGEVVDAAIRQRHGGDVGARRRRPTSATPSPLGAAERLVLLGDREAHGRAQRHALGGEEIERLVEAVDVALEQEGAPFEHHDRGDAASSSSCCWAGPGLHHLRHLGGHRAHVAAEVVVSNTSSTRQLGGALGHELRRLLLAPPAVGLHRVGDRELQGLGVEVDLEPARAAAAGISRPL